MEREIKIALLSNITIDLLVDDIKNNIKEKGADCKLWVGGYNQYKNEILNENSHLYKFEPKYLVIYLDTNDLFAFINSKLIEIGEDERKVVSDDLFGEIKNIIGLAQARLNQCTILINSLYIPAVNILAGLEYNSLLSLKEMVRNYNQKLGNLATLNDRVIIYDVESLVNEIGYKNFIDERLWYLAKMNLTKEGIKELAYLISRTIISLEGLIKKCIVLDLDNTLWGGIIGEDGKNGIKLGPDGIDRAFVDFQIELKNLSKQGVILAICSKNNYADALDVINTHPYMILKEDDFSGIYVNWDDKPTNLKRLAEDLNIGIDSLVFIDDNPFEREYVKNSLPEVEVPEWPSDPVFYKTALMELYKKFFFKTRITKEDKERVEMYRAQGQRIKIRSKCSSLEEYLSILEMVCIIKLNDNNAVSRISQLTQRTNQFNLTTKRYTEADINNFMKDKDAAVFSLQLLDKFGDNGIVGVIIMRKFNQEAWQIDTFLLSCRVIGRKVEQAFLGTVLKKIVKTGAKVVIGRYIPSAKNQLVSSLYKELGFEFNGNEGESSLWKLDLNKNIIKIPKYFKIEADL